MCRDPFGCEGETDHCCVLDDKNCRPYPPDCLAWEPSCTSLPRLCSPSMQNVTPEQYGQLPLTRRDAYYKLQLMGSTGGTLAPRFSTVPPFTGRPPVMDAVEGLGETFYIAVAIGCLVMSVLIYIGWKENWLWDWVFGGCG